MTDIPNLGGVITTDDISTKGTGSYAADYINWAKIAHLLHVHAPGWQFALRTTPEGNHIFTAPDGSGYVVGYFVNGTQQTPDFPQACMDNRNNPIPAERITARTLTDTHRRCLCTAAAFTFGLGYELWARVEVENPMRDDHSDNPAPASTSASKPQPGKVKTVSGGQLPYDSATRLTPAEIKELVQSVVQLGDERRDGVIAAFREHFKLPAGKAADYIKTKAHKDFLTQQIHAAAA